MEVGFDFLAGGLLALLTISIVIFFLTSRLIKEEFEFIDYVSVTGMIFAFNLLIYLILGVVLSLFDYDTTGESVMLVALLFFIMYLALSFFTSFWVLRNTIMFVRTRVIVSIIYGTIFAALFTLFGGIL